MRDIFSSAFGIWESCAGVSSSGQNRLGSLTAHFRWIFWIDTCWVHNPSAGTAAPWPGCVYCCVNVMNTQPCKPRLQAQVGDMWILHENFSHAYLREKNKSCWSQSEVREIFLCFFEAHVGNLEGAVLSPWEFVVPLESWPRVGQTIFWVFRVVWDSLLNSMRSLVVFSIF